MISSVLFFPFILVFQKPEVVTYSFPASWEAELAIIEVKPAGKFQNLTYKTFTKYTVHHPGEKREYVRKGSCTPLVWIPSKAGTGLQEGKITILPDRGEIEVLYHFEYRIKPIHMDEFWGSTAQDFIVFEEGASAPTPVEIQVEPHNDDTVTLEMRSLESTQVVEGQPGESLTVKIEKGVYEISVKSHPQKDSEYIQRAEFMVGAFPRVSFSF